MKKHLKEMYSEDYTDGYDEYDDDLYQDMMDFNKAVAEDDTYEHFPIEGSFEAELAKAKDSFKVDEATAEDIYYTIQEAGEGNYPVFAVTDAIYDIIKDAGFDLSKSEVEEIYNTKYSSVPQLIFEGKESKISDSAKVREGKSPEAKKSLVSKVLENDRNRARGKKRLSEATVTNTGSITKSYAELHPECNKSKEKIAERYYKFDLTKEAVPGNPDYDPTESKVIKFEKGSKMGEKNWKKGKMKSVNGIYDGKAFPRKK